MIAVFETERLIIRKLVCDDLKCFHTMQSNLKVMQYTLGKVLTYNENKADLNRLITLYDKPNNDFWIYAVERKSDNAFLGTVAIIKNDNNEDEIGFRFLEKYWHKGYGNELVGGLITYCKTEGFVKLIACVVTTNIASAKIIKNKGFLFVEDFVSDDLKLPEQKFKRIL